MDDSDPEYTDDEIEDMDIRTLRKTGATGMLKLFQHPDVVFVLDALLEMPPGNTFTKQSLADQAGLSIDTLKNHFELLEEAALIRPAEQENEYTQFEESLTYTELLSFHHATNRVLKEDTEKILKLANNSPERRFSYHCPECGSRGSYSGKAFNGHHFVCPEECTEWIFTGDDPPAYVLRWDSIDITQDDIKALRRKKTEQGSDALTDYENALLDLLEEQESPGPFPRRDN